MATSRNDQIHGEHGHSMYSSLPIEDILPSASFTLDYPPYSSLPSDPTDHTTGTIQSDDVGLFGLNSQADMFDAFGENNKKEIDILKMHR